MKYRNFEIVISPVDPDDMENENVTWEIWGIINGARECVDTSIDLDGFESEQSAIRDAKNKIDDPNWFNCFNQ